jgi:capsular exopolysaccharide synthesis family protein
VLLQADLRRPSLGNVFPSGGQGSLTACLIGRSDVDESRLPTPIRNLDFVPSGPIPPNPVELLASDRMTEILERLRKDADVVIIDSPPMLPVADASVLASRVDGVILVVRAGKSRRDHIRDAASALGKSGGRILGVVLNAVGPGDSQYGYYYGYGYRSQAQPASAPGTPAR